MLADVEVGAFDAVLGVFDDVADEAGFQRERIVDLEALHQTADLFAAEEAHQIIFQREVEARGTRITLTGGAAAQLVVDAAGLVAFGADDVQATELLDALHVFEILKEVLTSPSFDAVLGRDRP